MYDQNPTDPYMLDCMVCAEHAAIKVTVEGIFYCKECDPHGYENPRDEYCISCGVDSRAPGREVCAECHEVSYGQHSTSSSWGRGYNWWDDEEDEYTIYTHRVIEDDVELIPVTR